MDALLEHILETKRLFFSNWSDMALIQSNKIGSMLLSEKESREYPSSSSPELSLPTSLPDVPVTIPNLPPPTPENTQSGAHTSPPPENSVMLPPPRLGAVAPSRSRKVPSWHAPWKLLRVISGHLGWVRSIVVDPGNDWFATASVDRTIKIWDLASGTLKLTLTGHVSVVRGLAISDRHPYLFSCGEDKLVKCWDLEQNKVVRSYHGHLSGVYSIAVHPTLDLLITGGRDSTARVWDMRTKAAVHVLSGHTNTVASIVAQGADPQVVTGSMDTTIRLWDVRTGTVMSTLTHHKKSIRSLALHPHEFTFASGAADNIKKWRFPEGRFLGNLSGHNAIINCLAVNSDGVLVSGGDNGTIGFWDWASGYKFQQLSVPPQPGSLQSEAGIYSCAFDRSGCRLITGEADKSIKIWGEDPEATPESFPIVFTPEVDPKKY